MTLFIVGLLAITGTGVGAYFAGRNVGEDRPATWMLGGAFGLGVFLGIKLARGK